MWAVVVLGYWARLFGGIIAAALSITWLLHIALCACMASRSAEHRGKRLSLQHVLVALRSSPSAWHLSMLWSAASTWASKIHGMATYAQTIDNSEKSQWYTPRSDETMQLSGIYSCRRR